MTTRLDELFAGLPPRLDVHEVANLLGMTPKGVYRWINAGTIPAYKLGATWFILRDELRDAMASGSNLTRPLSVDPPPDEDGAAPEE